MLGQHNFLDLDQKQPFSSPFSWKPLTSHGIVKRFQWSLSPPARRVYYDVRSMTINEFVVFNGLSLMVQIGINIQLS